MAISCSAYNDFLARKTEHFDDAALLDRRPRDDAWIGHTLKGQFPAFDGTTHTFNRFNGAYPDLRGSWEDVPGGLGCIAAPCAPAESEIGWGVTQVGYGIQRKAYRTRPICWNLSMSADWANEQLMAIVKYLRRSKDAVYGNWLKTYAFMNTPTVFVANAAGTELTTSALLAPGFAADIIKLPPGTVVSKLQYNFLARFIGPLERDGYFAGDQFEDIPMYKIITDRQTAWELREGNPEVQQLVRLDSFRKGGEFYKYGVSEQVGNFMISYDNLPMRYQYGAGGNLYRVYPYTNVPTTIGIKDQIEPAYESAPFQLSPIWHPEVLMALTQDWRPPTADGMDFKPLDMEGRWKFEGGSVLVVKNSDGTTCTVDNKARNQGFWWNNFQLGIKPQRTELARWILHQRRVPCVLNVTPCPSTYPTYVTQSGSASNATCPG